MKRVLSCFLACLTLLSCLLIAPLQTNAVTFEGNDVSAKNPSVAPSVENTILAELPTEEKGGTLSSRNGQPADLVGLGQKPREDAVVHTLPSKYADPSGYVPTEQEAYNIMIAEKKNFPEGMRYTNDDYYGWKGGIWSGGYGCAGFCFYLSDLCFGDAPAYIVEEFYYNQIRVGDILRVNNDTHSVTVMEIYSDGIVLAEANYNSSVHWGRFMTYDEVMTKTTFLISRYPKNGWYTFDGYEYYYKNDVPVTGWAYDEDGNEYYFDSKGRMYEYSWLEYGDEWYYFGEYGYMACSEWVKIGKYWYYFDADGCMAANEWAKDSVGWCYMNGSGHMVYNKWVKDSKGWCYLGSDGHMVYNKWVSDSKGWCYVGASGYMVYNKWVKDSSGWCYIGSDGYMVVNDWAKDSNGWCYLNRNGHMVYNKWIKDSKGWCYVGSDGYLVTNDWAKDSNGWCYMNSSGYMTKSKWVKDGGKWYYLDADGYMVTGTKKIDGKTYKFNSSGVWIS